MPKYQKSGGTETSVNDRLITAFRHMRQRGIVQSQKDVADAMDRDATEVSMAFRGMEGIATREFVETFNEAFNNMFNLGWLMSGEGEMLVAGGGMPVTPTATARKVTGEVIWAPVIPHALMRKPDIDIMEALAKSPNTYKAEFLCSGNIDVDLWARMDSSALYPEIMQGDYIGLKAIPKDGMTVIPGEIYAVNTRAGGLVVRKLSASSEDGLTAYSADGMRRLYPDFTIRHSDIIRLFRRVIVVRF